MKFDNFLDDFIINKVEEIKAYKTECECGFKNLPNNLLGVCPLCGKNLHQFTLKEIA